MYCTIFGRRTKENGRFYEGMHIDSRCARETGEKTTPTDWGKEIKPGENDEKIKVAKCLVI